MIKNIKHAKVLGSGAVVNKTIQRFANGEIRVLMLNASNYGSGLNLQMATDLIIYHQLPLELETQVIGKGQRLGRTTELNIYYLLHEYEQNNVTNPSLSLDLSNTKDSDEFDKHLGKIEVKNSKTLSKKVGYEVDFDDCLPEIFGENMVTIKKRLQTKQEQVNQIKVQIV